LASWLLAGIRRDEGAPLHRRSTVLAGLNQWLLCAWSVFAFFLLKKTSKRERHYT
jgi:hypothetical protein